LLFLVPHHEQASHRALIFLPRRAKKPWEGGREGGREGKKG